jgi:hypothetical protein
VAATLETSRTDAHHTIYPEQLENLPNRDREPLAFSELAVAVAANKEGSAPSVMEHGSALNHYVVDGFNRTGSITGTARILAPQSAVNEFDVRINGYGAEAGGAASGLFNIATKAGTNRLHGSLFDFYGDRSLNAATTTDSRAGIHPPYRSNQFGGVVGGPLLQNRDFYLVSYEGARQTTAGGTSVDFRPFASSDPRTDATLSQLRGLAARLPRDSRRDMWLVKADHEFNGGNLRLQYAERQSNGVIAGIAGPAPVVPTTGATNVRARMFGASFGAVAGGFINEMRAQYAHDRDRESADAPALTVFQGGALVLRTGASPLGPHDTTTDRLQVGDTVSMANGAHATKVGVDMLRDQNRFNSAGRSSSAYLFRSLASLASGLPTNAGESYTQTFATGAGDVSADVQTYSAFVQDTWRVSQAVTADLGVRYDLQAFTRVIPRDTDNWAPRIGVAIRSSEHGVIRTGYGLYYGFTPALIPAFVSFDSSGNTTTVAVHGALAPRYPNVLAVPPSTRRSITMVDPQFENAQIQQANFGYEWEKYRNGTVAITYLYARGTHLPRMIEANGRNEFSAFDRVAEYQSTGESLYNAITTRVRITETALTFNVAYTFAHLNATPFGVYPVQFGTVADRSVLAEAQKDLRTPADQDHHHHLAMSLLYDTTVRANEYHGLPRILLRQWTLSFTYDALSGAPYSAYIDGDLNGDGNPFNDLAPGTRRNQYRMPWQVSFNPRASRDFHRGNGRKLSLIWEAFNVFNRPNYIAADDMFYALTTSGLQRNPLFGRKTAQDEGRVMQVAAKVAF